MSYSIINGRREFWPVRDATPDELADRLTALGGFEISRGPNDLRCAEVWLTEGERNLIASLLAARPTQSLNHGQTDKGAV